MCALAEPVDSGDTLKNNHMAQLIYYVTQGKSFNLQQLLCACRPGLS